MKISPGPAIDPARIEPLLADVLARMYDQARCHGRVTSLGEGHARIFLDLDELLLASRARDEDAGCAVLIAIAATAAQAAHDLAPAVKVDIEIARREAECSIAQRPEPSAWDMMMDGLDEMAAKSTRTGRVARRLRALAGDRI